MGIPHDVPLPRVGGLAEKSIRPLAFGRGRLGFALPGMSDVMPYPSSSFSALSESELASYRIAWADHVATVAGDFEPDVIHSHHIWLMSAIARRVLPNVPLVVHCHATGLRQLSLCPELAEEVVSGCSKADRFVVLHAGHRAELASRLGIEEAKVEVVGAGYREDLFHDRGREPGVAPRILFVGKYSAAKGLPWLIDAYERLAAKRPDLELHLAGGGDGRAADALRRRLGSLGPRVVQHGLLSQAALAGLMRRCDVFVLPSLYEGLPLVLVEAFACGCRLVATALPGVESELAPRLGSALRRVPPPRLRGVDEPLEEDLGGFVERLADALAGAVDDADQGTSSSSGGPAGAETLMSFTWRAVFSRVESVWRDVATG